MDGFHLYRADRVAGTKMGGVAVYIENSINKSAVDMGSVSSGTAECQVLYIS